MTGPTLVARDRWFESISLQQRVSSELGAEHRMQIAAGGGSRGTSSESVKPRAMRGRVATFDALHRKLRVFFGIGAKARQTLRRGNFNLLPGIVSLSHCGGDGGAGYFASRTGRRGAVSRAGGVPELDASGYRCGGVAACGGGRLGLGGGGRQRHRQASTPARARRPPDRPISPCMRPAKRPRSTVILL